MRFSLVVAACNVAEYVERMIVSLLEQSCGDFEVLLVCEESSDDTVEILHRLVDGDQRFTIYPLPRSGSASASRNFGVEHASGEYVLFIDGDDWLDLDALEKFSSAIERSGGAELICGEYTNWLGDRPCGGERPHRDPGRILGGGEALLEFLHDGSYRSAVWRNIYRRDWLVRCGLKQPVGRRHQDDLWTPQIFCSAPRVLVSGVRHYNYLKRANSVTTDRNERSLYDVAANIRDMVNFLRARRGEMADELLRELSCWQIRLFNRFFAPHLCRSYSRAARRRAVSELYRDREFRRWYAASLKEFGGVRDRLFGALLGGALCSGAAGFAGAEILWRWIYRGER